MSVALRIQNPIAPTALVTNPTQTVRHVEPVDRGHLACEAPDAGYSRSAEAPDAGYSRNEAISAVFSHGRSRS
ncbi:hypothetical protein TA3x_005399 [Tundrisphaera sp. TA3]|uniref:hypothetical protein n=1 Tax=Tundrisphaera sp. TA3 TaxID=3435775 RepID=UPI003EBF326C